MNRIPANYKELETQLIEFYNQHDVYVHPKAAEQIIENWSYAKYPIWEAMGGRIKIYGQNEKPAASEISLKDTYRYVCYELKRLKESKTSPDYVKISLLDDFESFVTSYPNEEIERKTKENTALSKEVLFQFVYRVVRRNLSYGDREMACKIAEKGVSEAHKQVKFSKQLQAALVGITPFAEEYPRVQVALQKAGLVFSEIRNALQQKPTFSVSISIDPYDYYTMSVNKSGWTSCYTPDGDYRMSPISVMCDSSTLVSYVGKPDDKRYRAMLHFDKDMKAVMINKIYPNYFFAKMNNYSQMIATMLYREGVIPMYSLSHETRDFDYVGHDTVYHDAECNSVDLILFETDYPSFEVGNSFPCFECGHEEAEERFACVSCSDESFCCTDCGDFIRDPYWDYGDPFCEDCYNEMIARREEDELAQAEEESQAI